MRTSHQIEVEECDDPDDNDSDDESLSISSSNFVFAFESPDLWNKFRVIQELATNKSGYSNAFPRFNRKSDHFDINSNWNEKKTHQSSTTIIE